MQKTLANIYKKIMLSRIPSPIKSKISSMYSLYHKVKYIRKEHKTELGSGSISVNDNSHVLEQYVEQILSIPDSKSLDYCKFTDLPYHYESNDPKIIAYYLTQFHPTKENDEWWGLGTTEWNNVSRAVPQFLGHYQPRLPGELGYYDLRIKENMLRQAALAKTYGVSSFCFYYYWFDGKRLLEKPLDLFLENKDIDIEFCLCWANENWTKRFDGTSSEILMKVGNTSKSYKDFILDIKDYLDDSRYMKIQEKKVLLIYRPSKIPNPEEVVSYWRAIAKSKFQTELYIIGVDEMNYYFDYKKYGFDAMSEFQPGTSIGEIEEIDLSKVFVRSDFEGHIYDYEKATEVKSDKYSKIFKAVMPMWDNTPRRNNKGVIFHNSTPKSYQEWLERVIIETRNNTEIEENLIFINAWNEWGEGTYLEPDRKYGYAYLNATKNSIENTRQSKKED